MKKDANITLEIGVIMPVVLFFLLIIIYGGIYFHDRCFLQGVANQIALKVCEKMQGHDNYKERIENGIYYSSEQNDMIILETENIIKEQTKFFFLSGTIHYTFNYVDYLAYKKIDIKLTKDFNTPFKMMNRFLSEDGNTQLEANSNISVYHPASMINHINFLDDFTSNITMTKELKDQYNSQMIKIRKELEKWLQ